MAFVTDVQSGPASTAGKSIKTFFSSVFSFVGKSMVLSMEASARTAKIEELNRKSDEELAKMGVRREDIVRLVFCDILYV